MTEPRHRVGAWTRRDAVLSRLLPPERRRVNVLVGTGLLIALIAGAVAGWDYLHVRGHPAERATVIARVPTGDDRWCGRFTRAEYLVTWHSADPPPGLPDTFADANACDELSLGQEHTVVCVVDGSDVHVYVDPATSVLQVGLWIVGGFVGGVVIGLLILGFNAVRCRLAHGRHRGGTQD